jgi:hypothetical protein
MEPGDFHRLPRVPGPSLYVLKRRGMVYFGCLTASYSSPIFLTQLVIIEEKNKPNSKPSHIFIEPLSSMEQKEVSKLQCNPERGMYAFYGSKPSTAIGSKVNVQNQACCVIPIHV